MTKIKMYCIFAKESIDKMKGNRGKMAAQAGHAFLHSWWDANYAENAEMFTTEEVIIATRKVNQARSYYDSDHAYKITLVVDTVDELKALEAAYKDVCGTALIKDAGFTVFDEPTVTCLGIGPIREDLIQDDLKKLKLFI